MNLFEDILIELEEENLLENPLVGYSVEKKKISEPLKAEIKEKDDILAHDEILETEKFLKHLESEEQENMLEIESPTQVRIDSINPPPIHNESQNPSQKRKLSEFELFRKRAMEEVSALQMVDNIFSSVEREQMKIVPKPFYDLPVKQILHSFLQLQGDVRLAEHAKMEFELRQEMGNWHSALADRDLKISVSNLRYCCETTRPPLSPPALLALAKFYRNAPFSEDCRNKFDLIITRLFTRDVENSKRELVFSHEELTQHLGELYAEWESIAFYPTDEKNEEILVTVFNLEDFIKEAGKAENFDDLIKTEFFNRVRAFKRSTGENFFAPPIAAISIICNVKIGNRYIDLLQIERETTFEEAIEEKYGFIFDQSISEATNKSLQLAELLKQRKQTPHNKKVFDLEDIKRQQNEKYKPKTEKNDKQTSKSSVFQMLAGVNKWILALTVLSVFLSVGIYFWVEVLSAPPKLSVEVKEVNLENTEFKDFIGKARMTNETLFAITTPAWVTLQLEKKEEILTKLLADGSKKGYKKVQLLDENGLTTGSATQNKIEVK